MSKFQRSWALFKRSMKVVGSNKTLLLFACVLDVASRVYRAALYIYATEGVVPGPFEKDQMDMGWKVRTGRKAR